MFGRWLLKIISLAFPRIDSAQNRWRLLGVLYESKMSTLFMAVNGKGVLCVVKRARLHTHNPDRTKNPEIDPASNRRTLENDAAVLSVLERENHPNILRRTEKVIFFDENSVDQAPFFVSEYLQGTLRDWIDEKSTLGKIHSSILRLLGALGIKNHLYLALRFLWIQEESLYIGKNRTLHGRVIPVEQTLQIVQQLADALACVHDKGYVHLDISLKNLGLRRLLASGESLQAYDIVLFDFGLTTRLGTVCSSEGTKRWMEPARLFYNPAQPLLAHLGMDIYALALLLRCLLTGKDPESMPDTYEQQVRWLEQLRTPIPDESLKFQKSVSPEVRREIAKRLNQLLIRCLELEYPNRRPNAREVRTEAAQIEGLLPQLDKTFIGVLSALRISMMLLSILVISFTTLYFFQSSSTAQPVQHALPTASRLSETVFVAPSLMPLVSQTLSLSTSSAMPINTPIVTPTLTATEAIIVTGIATNTVQVLATAMVTVVVTVPDTPIPIVTPSPTATMPPTTLPTVTTTTTPTQQSPTATPVPTQSF